MSQGNGKRVTFQIGDVAVQAEWNDSETARKIRDALPLEAAGSYWGGEIYFGIPVSANLEPGAQDVVEAGTVAYWAEGQCLCIFWGPTPASHGSECRAASEVNVVGRVLDPSVLPQLKARKVRVEAAE